MPPAMIWRPVLPLTNQLLCYGSITHAEIESVVDAHWQLTNYAGAPRLCKPEAG